MVAQERASSLKREQSLKGPKDLAATYNLQLVSFYRELCVENRSFELCIYVLVGLRELLEF